MSLLALLGDSFTRRTLQEAILAAAQSALNWIEEQGARARVTHKGTTTSVVTRNLTAALFLHELSRSADPQLHVHAVVMNMTRRPDGAWRSLASQIKGYRQDSLEPPLGFFEHVRYHQQLYGTLFRSELALRLKEQGFRLSVDATRGFFEVVGISSAAQAAYSSRAHQIHEHIALKGQNGAKAKSVATLLTRPAKATINSENLHVLWKEKGRVAGVDAFAEVAAVLQERALQHTPFLQAKSHSTARAALEKAIAQCTESHTVLRGSLLIQAAIAHTLGVASTQQVLGEFEQLRSEGKLLPLGNPQSDRYTTPHLLAKEKELITAAQRREPLKPNLSTTSLQAFLAEQTTLYPRQKASLRLLFLHPERIQACTGPALSGKTFLIPAILRLVSLSGKRALVLNSPSSTQSNLYAACGLSHRLLSVSTCLQKASRARLPRDTVLLVDNASDVPLQQLAALVDLAQRSQARLILLGDTQNLTRGELSDPFSILVENGLSTARLSLPQQVSSGLYPSLSALFQSLGERIIAIPDKETRLHTMVAQYLALSPEDQKSALLVMPSLTHCQEIHSVLRTSLQSSGQLGQDSIISPVLLPKFLQPTEKDRAECYTVGDWLRYKGQYGRISHCDTKTQTLTLQTRWGLSTRFSLQKASKHNFPLDVFIESTRALASGDKLRALVSQPALKISSGECCRIVAYTAHWLTLEKDNGRRLRLDISRPRNRHWDYGYAVTPASVVFPSPRLILAYQPSISRWSNKRSFKHLLQRAQGNLWLYTEHKELLLQTIRQQSGSTPSLHESLSKEEEKRDPAFAAVQHSITHISEREAAFRSEALFAESLRHSVGKASSEALQTALQVAKEDGSLKTGTQGLQTTEEALSIERDIIRLAKAEQNTLPVLVDAAALEAYLAKNTLNPEQAQALTMWTQSRNAVVLIEGYAGTQKTTLLQKAQPLLATSGFALETLAPTHTAVKELEARGLAARTLESFLNAPYPRTEKPPVYAIDEHSMVSNEKIHRFLVLAKTQGARVLLLGDSAQYTAIEAGNPQVLLPASGVETASLTQIERQKNPVLQQAVKNLYAEDIPAAFACLKDNIIEMGKTSLTSLDNTEKRCKRIAQDYAALSSAERAQTLVLTGSNSQRTDLNRAIRQQLKLQGELRGSSIETSIWVAQDRSQAQLRDSRYYQVSQWLLSKAGEYQEIIAVHGSSKGLSLRTATGNTLFYLPEAEQSRVQLYQKEKRELSVGDTLRWTRSDTALGLRSSEHVRIERLEQREMEVRSLAIGSEGFTLTGSAFCIPVDDSRYQHWDYAYALTGYAAQGKSIARVLCNMDSYSRYTTNARFFLIALTRSIHHFTLYTDNTTALLDKLLKTPALKYTALESVQEYPFSAPKPQNPQNKIIPNKTSDRLDIDRIVHDLHARSESVTRQLLGKPLSQTTTHYRYSHSQVLGGESTQTAGGSLFVAVRGPKAGLWHSFKTGEGGNLLQLIQKKVGGNFQKSVHVARDLLGGERTFFTSSLTSNKKLDNPVPERKSLAYARRLARESRRIGGTLAECYLREHRGITLATIPKDLRYHPGIYSAVNQALHPALLAIARNKEGQVQAVQAIYLDKDTGDKANVLVVKQTWGSLAGSAVDMSVSSSSTLPRVTYLAEGIETALSLSQSLTNGQVKAVLGKSNFARASLPEGKSQIVLCLDNDGRATPDPTIQKAAARLTEQGAMVWIAQPKVTGQDYNDMLRQEGSKAVESSIEAARILEIDAGGKERGVMRSSFSLGEYLTRLDRQNQKSTATLLLKVGPVFTQPELQKVALQKVKEIEIEL